MIEEIQLNHITKDDKQLLQRFGALVRGQGARAAQQEAGSFLDQASEQGRTGVAQRMLMIGLTGTFIEEFGVHEKKQKGLWQSIEARVGLNSVGLS